MYLLLGDSYMKSSDYERATQSFEHAQATLHNHTGWPPLVVSLVNPVLLSRNKSKLVTILDRYPDGSLMALQLQFNGVFARPFMQRVVRRRPASLY